MKSNAETPSDRSTADQTEARVTREAIQAVVTRLANGDRSALAQAYELLWPVVRAFCRKSLQCTSDADDVAQEALIRFVQQVGAFETDKDALTWVLTIAVWECRSARRRHQRRVARLVDEVDEFVLVSDSPTAEALLAKKQVIEAVEELIGRLPAEQRDAIKAAVDGLVLDPKMRKRKQRAMKQLKRWWRIFDGQA